jgi:Lrp/AsnC family transcriptional regulator for asnA, asnC and gidA
VTKIDPIDRAIVKLLLEDGRMASADIARRLGNVSGRVVRYRISRLIHKGIVEVSAIVNPKALGFSVMADIYMEIESGYVRGVARAMAAHEQVSYVALSTGDKDLSIQVYARDAADLHRFLTGVVADMPGVRKTSTILLPEKLKDVYDWSIPDSCAESKEDNI